MKKPEHKIKVICLLASLLLTTACASNSRIPFHEIADPMLEEMAIIRLVRLEATVVAYNPITCEQIGEACRFFRTHAFAHSWLRHMILKPKYYTRSNESQADCWAAKQVTPEEASATVDFLLDSSLHEGLRIYGDPVERAETIRRCAIAANNWPVH